MLRAPILKTVMCLGVRILYFKVMKFLYFVFWKWSLMIQEACMFGAWKSQLLWSLFNFLPLWHRFSTICSWPRGPCLASSSISLTLFHHCYYSLTGMVIGSVTREGLCSIFIVLPYGFVNADKERIRVQYVPCWILRWSKKEAIFNQAGSTRVHSVGA